MHRILRGETGISDQFTLELLISLDRNTQDWHGTRSTLATSQLPIDKWHDIIDDATLAKAILDRLVHNAYKINLKGESMRKRKATLTRTTLVG
jgi:hypothetical protein